MLVGCAVLLLGRYLSTRPPPGPDTAEEPQEPQQGLTHEVMDFVGPLFLSLLPSWTPPVRVAPLPMPTQDEPQPAPHAVPEANDGM
jgi:hypothetical protein